MGFEQAVGVNWDTQLGHLDSTASLVFHSARGFGFAEAISRVGEGVS